MKKWIALLVFYICYNTHATAQDTPPINPDLLSKSWPASWISCPNAPQRDYGVYHFRKKISLKQKPSRFIVHASGDNRYRLLVNGKTVLSGPARGDLYNWYFETVDLAPHLKAGENIISALVWNMGVHAPVAQISNQTAFLLQGDGEAEKLINTDKSWKAFHNKAYTPCSTNNGERLYTYMVIGPGDEVDASKYPWGWENLDFNDSAWLPAKQIANPVTAGYGSDNLWTLVPRNIPLMEEKLQRLATVRKAEGAAPGAGFLKGKQPFSVPANRKVTLLLDQSYNTIAYPELTVSGGKGAEIKVTYAEALFVKDNARRNKGNRNEVEGKEMLGNFDIFRPDGGKNRLFKPLWLRTYRYIQLEISTKSDPLTVNDLAGIFTAYPFKEQATFSSNDQSLQQIWNVGWRTARLCAGETYFDCPYYEQLQYEGDTRIQSLISLYVTGDDRLMRKAILDFYHSRVPEGLTQGRYPSSRLQVIPPFSLYWISMLHDYWMHRSDTAFVANFLVPVQGVLDWYEKRIDREKQLLGPMKWWNFVDWNLAFDGGTPTGANDGNSSIVTLQYVYTLQQAAELFEYFGRKNEAQHYRNLAATLAKNTYRQCFDHARGIMGDTPEKKAFSQHAGIMAVLAGAIPEKQIPAVMKQVLYNDSLSQATFYYRFYLTQALKKAGMADLYYSQLKPWRDMLGMGLTTFAEQPDPTRSDCHAWSASPNYDFFATICGIMPDKPGFAAVKIAPALGELTEANGKIPHPDGEISVQLKRKDKKGITAQITLPGKLTGTFVWNGKEVKLKGGSQTVEL